MAIWEHRLFAGNTAKKTRPDQALAFSSTVPKARSTWDGSTAEHFIRLTPKNHLSTRHPKLDKPDDQNSALLWTDFLSSIKINKRPVCDIEQGHHSTNMALPGMLSMKLGRSAE